MCQSLGYCLLEAAEGKERGKLSYSQGSGARRHHTHQKKHLSAHGVSGSRHA